jgi:hypothetical protein
LDQITEIVAAVHVAAVQMIDAFKGRVHAVPHLFAIRTTAQFTRFRI